MEGMTMATHDRFDDVEYARRIATIKLQGNASPLDRYAVCVACGEVYALFDPSDVAAPCDNIPDTAIRRCGGKLVEIRTTGRGVEEG
jgi:hypothetical protein